MADEVVDAGELHAFALRALTAVGMPDEQARTTADAMVWADLRGLAAHGVLGRLPQCVARIQEGGTDPRARPAPDDDGTRALVGMDGGNAWGQVAGVAAMRTAVERAARFGIGAVAVRDTGSPAALGYYPTLAIEQRMIGLAVTNCPALVAAPGGTTTVLGNQAHAVGVPAGRHPPILFDAALTRMSTGEMDRRRAAGLALPDGVLLDRHGRPTTDPAEWVEGILLPIGGHRGFGLALAFEVLTAVLAGSSRTSAAVAHPFEHDRPQGVSMTCLAIDPAATGPYQEFLDGVDRLIDEVHASGAPGGDRPRVPGERGHARAAERAGHGVPVDARQRERVAALAAELGITAPAGVS